MNVTAQKFVHFQLATHDQTAENLHKAIDSMLKMAGCAACGRIAGLRIDLGRPVEANIAKLGVISHLME